jgi:hypothetical protein
MEYIPEGEQVLAGTFSLKGHPIVILFDFGASHDFISKACTLKCQLIIQHLSTPYIIPSLGGRIITNQLVKNAPLCLGGKEYKTCLIVLDGQGIDVILGMGWMKGHKALLDTVTRVVHLDSSAHGVDTLQPSLPSVASPSVHHITTQNLEHIPMVCEFPDVFLEDLPDMPPVRLYRPRVARHSPRAPLALSPPGLEHLASGAADRQRRSAHGDRAVCAAPVPRRSPRASASAALGRVAVEQPACRLNPAQQPVVFLFVCEFF